MMYGKFLTGVLATVLCVGICAAMPAAPSIQGEYVEARTCDVWTGPCFSNSEINLRGKNAVVGWVVTKGTWTGTVLDGLKVMAILNSEGTLHTDVEGKVQAALIVDEKASEQQAEALVALARSLAPKHLENIVKVEKKAIAYSRKDLEVSLTAGSDVTLKTYALRPCDAICCHEEQAYPTVCEFARVDCAKTAENSYKGNALGGIRWTDLEKRSAMVGTFER